MPGHRIRSGRQKTDCGIPPSFARSQNCRNGTLGSQKRKTYVTKDKNHKIQKRITGYDVNASYPVLFLPGKP